MFFKVDCGFFDDPKIHAIGPRAAYVFLQSIAYSMLNLTDGFVPYPVARRMAGKDTRTKIVDSGIWISGGNGYLISKYLKHQKPASFFIRQREKWAEEKRDQRKCPPLCPPRTPET